MLSEIGCLLPQALQLGGANGPFDFQYVVDVLFQPEGGRRRRFGDLWRNYLDDFCIRSGRWFRNGPFTDEAYKALLAAATPPPPKPRSYGEVLEELGFTTEVEEEPTAAPASRL